mmetsp:Transcript_12592/g.38506  ORF Transcript_12592/g.38506 Transcript_12592/m.38506 type:complete len:325 (-) Transcript_12592:3332-4306(-)
MLEVAVAPAPSDGVTRVRYSRDGAELLVSSWSGSVNLYDGTDGHFRTSLPAASAVLDASYDASRHIYSCCLDGNVLLHELGPDGKHSSCVVGRHEKAARCLEVTNDSKLLISSGWDKMLHAWDPHSEKRQTHKSIFSVELPGRAFSMSLFGEHKVIVGTSTRHVVLYDIRKPKDPVFDRESLLKNQMRCIVGIPDESGFAASSTEGRVALEKLDGVGSYTFKCHRIESRIYPVNAIAFHPKYHTFATGGADGNVSVWDGLAKKRICQYPRYDTSIASLDFHPEGSLLAIAVSYTFEEGDIKHPPDRVLLRSVVDADVQPRTRRA